MTSTIALIEPVAWKPIETAPMDGRDLILTSPDWNGDVLVGSFAFGEWRENATPEAVSYSPTLWMSIPELPSTKEERT